MAKQGQGYQCINCSSVCVPLQPKEMAEDKAHGTVKLIDTCCPLCECEEFKWITVFVEVAAKCQACAIHEHDTCSLAPGCPCCDNTIEGLGVEAAKEARKQGGYED